MPATRSNGSSSGRSTTNKKTQWSGNEIRETFLSFFESMGHMRVPSSSLIPRNDPTVLLTTAGMQQMIPYFLGQEEPPAHLLTSVQKCFRTTDIDSVGDISHLTFFEMLGNFSVGEYFKRDAIAFAWQLLTQGFGLPAERLFPTVHPEDDEGPGLWEEIAGIPAVGITRLEDNWWGPPGASGPCGPDSEIYYDRGAEYGCGEPDCAPGCDRCSRYLEIWNLVFMQYYQDADGHREPLKKKNIDTGMGLERLAMVLQHKNSVFETDLFRPIIDKFASLAHTEYGRNPEHDTALRVIADHARALVFLAADGVQPDTSGRGYIFRRILRRAVRYGRVLGLEDPFLADAADTVIQLMAGHYTELKERREQVIELLSLEEQRFGRTLSVGLSLLTRELDRLEREGLQVVSGDFAFTLHDAHGFPINLTEEFAEDRGMTVDRARFEALMEDQRDKSRDLRKFVRNREEEAWTAITKNIPATVFRGYEGTLDNSEIVALVVNGKPADAARAPEAAMLVLAETPFYAEAGGQVGDQGVIETKNGMFVVEDTQRPVPGLIVHIGRVSRGQVTVGEEARAAVDRERRLAIMRNHSATHLLHRALKDVLGDQVNQQGSLVAPDRLRFDFNLSRPIKREEMEEIDRLVNLWIVADLPVRTDIMPYREAVATGAMALFSEKYGDTVRVVSMGMSKELCGGTHVAATGQIGLYLTTQESSVGTNLRRIEALTGLGAQDYLKRRSELVANVADRLQVTPDTVLDRIQQLQDELSETRRQLRRLKSNLWREEAARLAASPRDVRGIPVVSAVVDVESKQALREMGDVVRNRLGPGVICLASEIDDRIQFIVTVDVETAARGISAGTIARELGVRLGGNGGGRETSAEGGSRASGNLERVMHDLADVIAATVV